MKRRSVGAALPIAVAALGIAAGVLRYFELTDGLEHGLVGESPLIPAMRAAAIVGCVLAVLAAVAVGARRGGYTALYGSGIAKTVMVAAGFLFIAAAAVGILLHGTGDVMRLILSAFSAFAGAAMILSTARVADGEKDQRGIFAVIPVFLFGYLLVVLYVVHADDAVLEHHGYSVLAGVAATVAASYASALAYGGGKPKRALAASGVSLILSLIVALGEAFTKGDIQIAAIFGAAAVWSFALMCGLTIGEDIEEDEAAEGAEDEAESGGASPEPGEASEAE